MRAGQSAFITSCGITAVHNTLFTPAMYHASAGAPLGPVSASWYTTFRVVN
jgi:hypothetical protein